MLQQKGIPGAPGVAQGAVVFYRTGRGDMRRLSIQEARTLCIEKVSRLMEKAKREAGDEQVKLLETYALLLEDDVFFQPMLELAESGMDELQAVSKVVSQMQQVLQAKSSEYMRQRADDIRYVGEMLTGAMQGSGARYTLPEGETPFLLAAEELTPVDTMQFDTHRLLGLITERGGVTSHTVLLAKSLGIPAVVGAAGLMKLAGDFEETLGGSMDAPNRSAGEADRLEQTSAELEKGDETQTRQPVGFLDGYTGEFYLNPDETIRPMLKERLKKEEGLQRKLFKVRESEARTLDGTRVFVCVNIGSPLDLKGAETLQYDGVGLMRSEFLYASQAQKPSFEKQREAYQKILDQTAPRPIIIRTLDIGGDKPLPYLNMPQEENPFLGNRGIRLCLQNRDLFCEQLEAILAAAAGRPVSIMLPMVTSLSEIRAARSILKEAQAHLQQRKILFGTQVKLGIMIETPACVILAREFAKHCDFFSIGTNDLTQYLLCADRGNAAVEKRYDPFHPAVLRMLAQTIHAAQQADIEVSVCGDLAADLRFTALLLGMGLRKFSVPLPAVSRIKYEIGSIDLSGAQKLAQTVLGLEEEAEIRAVLERG